MLNTPLLPNDLEKEFDRLFVIDPAEVFFGNKEELKKQGWEVGKSKLIIKQDATPEQLKQFIAQAVSTARESEYNRIKEILKPSADKLLPIGTVISKWAELHNDMGGEVIFQDLADEDDEFPRQRPVKVIYHTPLKYFHEISGLLSPTPIKEGEV